MDECELNAIISLPKKTFFSTIQKTFILSITKKINKSKIQSKEVYTYLVSEIGETRDVNRFPIDNDDLSVAVDSYNSFIGSSNYFIKNNIDPRCKIVSFNWFKERYNSSWLIDNLWNNKEKIDLGIVEDDFEVNINDYKLVVDNLIETINSYKDELENLQEIPDNIKYIKRPLNELFDFKSGNSKLTQSYLNSNKGPYVVYSSNTKNKGILGYINSYDHELECIQITTNGVYAGTVFYREKHKFNINGDARLLIKKDDNLNYKYLIHELKSSFLEHNFSWENKPSIQKTQDIELKIPVDEFGNYSIEIQNILAERFEKILFIQNCIKNEVDKLNRINILINN
jgi:hypothetical protein